MEDAHPFVERLIDSLLRAYPSLQREDILACFDYAASLAEEEVTPLETVSFE